MAYDMAREFHVPPWVIEDDCTKEWLERHLAYQSAMSQERKRLEAKRGAKHH